MKRIKNTGLAKLGYMRTRPDPLRHWEYFVAVAEEGSVTAAAERLGVTQSPVSQGLKRLESSLGLQLTRRSSTGLVLTEAGRSLLPQARVLVRDTAELQSMAHTIADTGAETRLGLTRSVPPVVAYQLSAGLDSIGRVSVSTDDVAHLVTGVAEGRLDCAVLEDPAPTADLARGQLHEVPRWLAGVGQRPSAWSELHGHVLLDNTATVSPAAAERLGDAFFTLGLHPETRSWADRTELAAQLGRGRAMSLLTADQLGGLPAIPLPSAFTLRLRAVVPPRRDLPGATADLRDLIDPAIRNAVRSLVEP